MPMTKNKRPPLDELREEKEILKRECSEREDHLAEYWAFINDNAGILIMDGIIDTVKQKLGLAPSRSSSVKNHPDQQLPAETDESNDTGFMHTIKSGLQMTYPLIWEIAQPMLWDFALKKIKSIFTRKKKDKKKNKKGRYYFVEDDD